MADSDINGLTQAQADYVDETDELIIQKSGETSCKKIQVNDLFGGWKDLFPYQYEIGSGASAPSFATMVGNLKAWTFGIGDEI